LALTLPSADPGWLEGFARGFGELARAHGVALVGGDTTAGPLTISVQILGHVPRGSALTRAGGKAGDVLAVTGTLGDAGAGLALATGALEMHDSAAARELLLRFEYPTPRVDFGIAARGIASAAMDISDGLVGDLPKLAAAGGLGASVDVERLPMSRALHAAGDEEKARAWALGAGDDYELLIAVPPDRFAELASRAGQLNLTLTEIGALRRGNAVAWTLHGTEFTPSVRGFDHFRRASTQITV
jgi:thiamine-monophosphate kinase